MLSDPNAIYIEIDISQPRIEVESPLRLGNQSSLFLTLHSTKHWQIERLGRASEAGGVDTSALTLRELSVGGSLDAVLLQKRIECSGLTPSELLGQQMSSLAAPLPPDKQVLILPLVDQDSGRVLAVILMHCSPLNDADEQNLRTLEKHILVACKRVLAIQKLQPWTQVSVPSGSSENFSPRPQSVQKPQPWSQVSLSTGSPENSLQKPETLQNEGYDELDRKILQLCVFGRLAPAGTAGTTGNVQSSALPSGALPSDTGEPSGSLIRHDTSGFARVQSYLAMTCKTQLPLYGRGETDPARQRGNKHITHSTRRPTSLHKLISEKRPFGDEDSKCWGVMDSSRDSRQRSVSDPS
ncbi:cGMP-dependent 3, 5 -cyclic phosphodiesterase [Pelobates cultripes]|uniref:cGMP-dependent 3,5 -cyclic phosphodiesterase n=1 Tax=Pelobates cultripes TaxID=61616 RepID=A0AAD1RAN0_PELCU|nr:cGMP-dependent 3, 5 -cyclic phosphodiesterase [Pelobates cultripes]